MFKPEIASFQWTIIAVYFMSQNYVSIRCWAQLQFPWPWLWSSGPVITQVTPCLPQAPGLGVCDESDIGDVTLTLARGNNSLIPGTAIRKAWKEDSRIGSSMNNISGKEKLIWSPSWSPPCSSMVDIAPWMTPAHKSPHSYIIPTASPGPRLVMDGQIWLVLMAGFLIGIHHWDCVNIKL